MKDKGIRIIYVEGNPWYSLEDVCEVLGRDPAQVLSRVDDGDKATVSYDCPLEGRREMAAVSCDAFGAIVKGSRNKAARISLGLWGAPGIVPELGA